MKKSIKKTIRVVELFAGVGGFRLGLDQASKKEGRASELEFETIWNNQWEPSTKRQHASEVYVARFGREGHRNSDIAKVRTNEIPEHDLLVGGFPCQDYSVARTLSHATGLSGKKGVLWWEIYRILKEKGPQAPKYLFLENVDRLLKSPASNRGRDFAIMLSSLASLGYVVEWRVINAAEYGKPQRRRRIYILGYKKGTGLAKAMMDSLPIEWLTDSGTFASNFKVSPPENLWSEYKIGIDPLRISEQFSTLFPNDLVFLNAGIMIDGRVWTVKTNADFKDKRTTLGDILRPEHEVPQEYFISRDSLKDWKYLKGGKKEARKTKNGFKYEYSEGPVVFPDPVEQPSRTIVTGEGGPTPSRFKHVIRTPSGKLRRLLPIELELLCQFPTNHTNLEGISDVKRAFFMGNALVVGIVEDIGRALLKGIKKHGNRQGVVSLPSSFELQHSS